MLKISRHIPRDRSGAIGETKLTPDQSKAVERARVICILMMSYVHLHFTNQPDNYAAYLSDAVVVDVLGRSSVPLLSVISGFMMVSYFARIQWWQGVRKRFRSLIVPMVLWNALALLVFWPPSGGLVNALFSVTDEPVLVYNAFLRDMFVLAALTPVLVWAVRHFPKIFAIIVFAYYIANIETVLILRPQIAGFYILGIYFAVFGGVNFPEWPIWILFGIVVVLEITGPPEFQAYDLCIRRPVTAATFWILAKRLHTIPALGRSVFVFFLSHGIIFHVIGSVYFRLGLLDDAYRFLWFITPPATLLVIHLALTVWQAQCKKLPSLMRSGVSYFI